MATFRHLTSDEFEPFVEVDGLVAVYFWAPWSSSCRSMTKYIEEAVEHKDSIPSAKINTDDSIDIASESEVRAVPTIVFFNKGDEVDRMSGLFPPREIVSRMVSLKNKLSV